MEENIMKNAGLDYNDYIEIAEGTYWVGFADENASLHCNPYLIADNGEAVLIDGGSRNDFSTVMLKIMRTGTNPHDIIRLIYQHYDPDLCGNIPHMEAIINNSDLKIISHYENNLFINYYSTGLTKQCIKELDYSFEFSSGRRLEFIRTPYSHSPGSFITYDTKTKVLFSSDIFGSYDANWNLYSQINEKCLRCEPEGVCSVTQKPCDVFGIWDFHKRIMTSKKALDYALDRIEQLDISMIAPQHGSIFSTPVSKEVAIKRLRGLKKVGIDHFLDADIQEESL
jgi:flavorubredoxin